MRKAILQVADTGPLESLVQMLRAVDYEPFLPDRELKAEMRRIGMDCVLDVETLVRGGSYDQPEDLPEAGLRDVGSGEYVLVDVKAHRAYYKILARWPRMEDRVLWYRINGGRPEHVIKKDGFDCGDEVHPPCPVVTPNQWYDGSPASDLGDGDWTDPATTYCCWPPFLRVAEYSAIRRRAFPYTDPICLVHNLAGWGYGEMAEPVRKLGVKVHGIGSPEGLMTRERVKESLRTCLAYVHLKSSDAPGYALYEAMAAGCPVVCSRRLIWRCRMQELLIPGETCLVFDEETHDALTSESAARYAAEIDQALRTLTHQDANWTIGQQGREQLSTIMWSPDRRTDVEGFRSFMDRNFGRPR